MNFLPSETINDPSALDAILVEMHKAYERENAPMTEDQTRWSVSIMMADDAGIERMYEDFKRESWQLAGFFERCNAFPIKYEKRLLVWLGVMHIDFGIGGMLLVAYYVQWWCYRNISYAAAIDRAVIVPIELSYICEKCFPMGVFTKETVHKFWDKQKVKARPDNLIDYPSAALSFMPARKN
jgi:hypothetical protein